ncbi:hypothetical protein GCM10022198_00330 [Klugiella xanthotipulae]|uniref:hypothetical protein n=1 Tax=Klugiella xanthotipulae TaxID=244735 RepID=UPI001B877EDF|nr:hypothetical protein [Klugiella xanthotipulae]
MYHHRRPQLPAELRERARWVRRDARKRPLDAITGKSASSTNPSTWAEYVEAKHATFGVGLGFVLGDGIGCIDLDHCLDDGVPTAECARYLADYPRHYVEVSPSGDGLHIWGTLPEGKGTRQIIRGLSVERYSIGRYITITGRVYQAGRILPL